MGRRLCFAFTRLKSANEATWRRNCFVFNWIYFQNSRVEFWFTWVISFKIYRRKQIKKFFDAVSFLPMPYFQDNYHPYKIAYMILGRVEQGIRINCATARLRPQKLTVQQEGFPRLTVFATCYVKKKNKEKANGKGKNILSSNLVLQKHYENQTNNHTS